MDYVYKKNEDGDYEVEPIVSKPFFQWLDDNMMGLLDTYEILRKYTVEPPPFTEWSVFVYENS